MLSTRCLNCPSSGNIKVSYNAKGDFIANHLYRISLDVKMYYENHSQGELALDMIITLAEDVECVKFVLLNKRTSLASDSIQPTNSSVQGRSCERVLRLERGNYKSGFWESLSSRGIFLKFLKIVLYKCVFVDL